LRAAGCPVILTPNQGLVALSGAGIDLFKFRHVDLVSLSRIKNIRPIIAALGAKREILGRHPSWDGNFVLSH
jgi:hypothetical protein